MSDDTKNKKKKYLIALVVIAAVTAVASAFPSVQNHFKQLISKNEREILAKITGFYGIDQNEYLILKNKDSSGLQIEIY